MASSAAGSRGVVAQDAFVYHARKEGSLRDELLEEMRDVLLAVGRESFVVARAASEGDRHGFAIPGG